MRDADVRDPAQLGALRDDPASTYPRADFLVGTPADVAQRLIALHRETRFDHFAHWARLPGLSRDRAVETLRSGGMCSAAG